MKKPFIYKYKPNSFNEFEIDKNIITILQTLIEMNDLNILFTGDSGSGKTTIIHALMNDYYENKEYSDNILTFC